MQKKREEAHRQAQGYQQPPGARKKRRSIHLTRAKTKVAKFYALVLALPGSVSFLTAQVKPVVHEELITFRMFEITKCLENDQKSILDLILLQRWIPKQKKLSQAAPKSPQNVL